MQHFHLVIVAFAGNAAVQLQRHSGRCADPQGGRGTAVMVGREVGTVSLFKGNGIRILHGDGIYHYFRLHHLPVAQSGQDLGLGNGLLVQIVQAAVTGGLLKAVMQLQAGFCAGSRSSQQLQTVDGHIAVGIHHLSRSGDARQFLRRTHIVQIRQSPAADKIGMAGIAVAGNGYQRSGQQQIVQAGAILKGLQAQVGQSIRQGYGGGVLAVFKGIIRDGGNARLHHNGGDLIQIVAPGIFMAAVGSLQGAGAGDPQDPVDQGPGGIAPGAVGKDPQHQIIAAALRVVPLGILTGDEELLRRRVGFDILDQNVAVSPDRFGIGDRQLQAYGVTAEGRGTVGTLGADLSGGRQLKGIDIRDAAQIQRTLVHPYRIEAAAADPGFFVYVHSLAFGEIAAQNGGISCQEGTLPPEFTGINGDLIIPGLQLHIAAGDGGGHAGAEQAAVNGAAGDVYHSIRVIDDYISAHVAAAHGKVAALDRQSIPAVCGGDPSAGNGQLAVLGSALYVMAVDGGAVITAALHIAPLHIDPAAGIGINTAVILCLHRAAADIGGGIVVGIHRRTAAAVGNGAAPDAQILIVADGAVAGGSDGAGAHAVTDQQTAVAVNVKHHTVAGDGMSVQAKVAGVAVVQDHGIAQHHILGQIVIAVVHSGGAVPGSPCIAAVRRAAAASAAANGVRMGGHRFLCRHAHGQQAQQNSSHQKDAANTLHPHFITS